MMTDKQFEQIFQLRFTVKQLNRQSRKAEKTAEQKKKQVALYLKRGNLDVAKVYATDAVRLRNESMSYLRLAAKLDGVKSRLEMMAMNQQVTQQLMGVVKVMGQHMESNNIPQMMSVYDKFEQQNEDLMVGDSIMNDALTSTTSSLAPDAQVEDPIYQVADEYSLEIRSLLPQINHDQILARRAAQAQQGPQKAQSLAS
eukprot:TRINITY_DN6631_c0_g2_i2.p2 TRINITY_DN6631_c0_g2~~TRINITY_DN6631_c0_g2_i2.p2  ORF type:complete len:199 (-),score=43.91 TRINITY_DN6631_c0_g2_i2:1830-2426(-)